MFLSGRLATLYTAFYKPLRLTGNAGLTTFADQDCFEMTARRLTLRLGLENSWQLHTALHVMQQGYQEFRCSFGKKGRIGYEIGFDNELSDYKTIRPSDY
jgi:hypothetical protein